jgi:hypothetical protein
MEARAGSMAMRDTANQVEKKENMKKAIHHSEPISNFQTNIAAWEIL